MKKWIGKHYTKIRVKDNPFEPEFVYRLICPDNVISADVQGNRINVYIDKNGVIKRISEG